MEKHLNNQHIMIIRWLLKLRRRIKIIKQLLCEYKTVKLCLNNMHFAFQAKTVISHEIRRPFVVFLCVQSHM